MTRRDPIELWGIFKRCWIHSCTHVARRRVPEVLVVEFGNFESDPRGGFFGGKILLPVPPPPQENRLEICHKIQPHSSH